MAQVAKAEVARAIEEYKRSIDFEDEVGEATGDTFQKGFAECKRKVAEAFLKLKLNSIVLDKPKTEEEDGTKRPGP